MSSVISGPQINGWAWDLYCARCEDRALLLCANQRIRYCTVISSSSRHADSAILNRYLLTPQSVMCANARPNWHPENTRRKQSGDTCCEPATDRRCRVSVERRGWLTDDLVARTRAAVLYAHVQLWRRRLVRRRQSNYEARKWARRVCDSPVIIFAVVSVGKT